MVIVWYFTVMCGMARRVSVATPAKFYEIVFGRLLHVSGVLKWKVQGEVNLDRANNYYCLADVLRLPRSVRYD